MARSFLDLPTLSISKIRPQKMSFDVVGNVVEGGRNQLGESISMDLSGGGMVVGSYENLVIHYPDEHQYLNYLSARLGGSARFINVPILTDWMGPFPTINGMPTSTITQIPHSDGSLFSDETGYSQGTVYGVVTSNAAANAGKIRIKVYGEARPLEYSDWFAIYHNTKGWRAYRYWDVISRSDDANPTYVLAIQPALREAVEDGTEVEFARPRFAAKLATGQTIPWDVEIPWVSRGALKFVEAF